MRLSWLLSRCYYWLVLCLPAELSFGFNTRRGAAAEPDKWIRSWGEVAFELEWRDLELSLRVCGDDP